MPKRKWHRGAGEPLRDSRKGTARVRGSLRATLLVASLCGLQLGVSECNLTIALPHPILFVTQVPVPADFATVGSVFANHGANPGEAARGGDLWIRYPDGTLRNLTKEAGYGTEGHQGADAIAVRNPAVHWNGKRALFSTCRPGGARWAVGGGEGRCGCGSSAVSGLR